jgi:hypothetical protein
MPQDRRDDRGAPGRRGPLLVVAAWILAAALAILAAPSLSTVALQDATALLPHDAPSQRADQLLHRLFPADPALDAVPARAAGRITSRGRRRIGLVSVEEQEHDQGTYQGVPFEITTDRVLEATP